MSQKVLLRGRLSRAEQLPNTRVAELVQGDVVSVPLAELFARGRHVILGVPGAFTPVCTRVHLPEFVEKTPALLRSGFSSVACIAPNDPWTLAEWAKRIDPSGAIRFLSDGNLEFGRAAGLVARVTELFLGERLSRFLIIAEHGRVERIAVEEAVTDVSCTAASTLF